MRRVFIIRKDLNLSPGKLAAMVGHCAEAFFTNFLKQSWDFAKSRNVALVLDNQIQMPVFINKDIWKKYINGIFTKTICEAKNLNDLNKVKTIIAALWTDGIANLTEGEDYGFINDKCLTELTPENPDGTTTVGVWFAPLEDELAHMISKKYKLYGAFDRH